MYLVHIYAYPYKYTYIQVLMAQNSCISQPYQLAHLTKLQSFIKKRNRQKVTQTGTVIIRKLSFCILFVCFFFDACCGSDKVCVHGQTRTAVKPPKGACMHLAKRRKRCQCATPLACAVVMQLLTCSRLQTLRSYFGHSLPGAACGDRT